MKKLWNTRNRPQTLQTLIKMMHTSLLSASSSQCAPGELERGVGVLGGKNRIKSRSTLSQVE